MVIVAMACSFDCSLVREQVGTCRALSEGSADGRNQQAGQRADVVERLEAEHGLFDGVLPVRVDQRVGQAAVLGDDVGVGEQPVAGARGATVFSRVLPSFSVTDARVVSLSWTGPWRRGLSPLLLCTSVDVNAGE